MLKHRRPWKNMTKPHQTSAYVSIRQLMSAYVSIRQHTSAYVIIHQNTSEYFNTRQHTSAYVSIRQHTSAHVSIRKGTCGRLHPTAPSRSAARRLHGSISPLLGQEREAAQSRCPCQPAYVSIRQHTSADVSIRQHTSADVSIREHT